MRLIPLVVLCVLFVIPKALGQCPIIKVVGPEGLTRPLEDVVFRAEVGTSNHKLEYLWSVDKGTIIKGQGTPRMTVRADMELAGEVVFATVEIDGLPIRAIDRHQIRLL